MLLLAFAISARNVPITDRAADNSRSPDKFQTKQPLVLSTMLFVRTNMNSKPWVKNYDCQMSGQT